MKEKLESVSFKLTPVMTKELIKFNSLKKELINLKNQKILDKEDLIKIGELENELNLVRISFINEFRNSNKEEIIKYLQLKDQIWSFFCILKGFLNFVENNIYRGKDILVLSNLYKIGKICAKLNRKVNIC